MSTNFDRFRTSQVFAELILPLSVLSFCSSETGKMKERKKGETALHRECWYSCCQPTAPGFLGLLPAIKT
jgi:hypothetical protein